MKRIYILLILAISTLTNAQTNCDYSFENKENGNDIKTTKDYMMYEKVFGGSSQFIFFSLTNDNGTPLLNFQLLAKSKEFPQLYCLSEASKIYLQLTNGKVITLINALDDQCGKLVYDDINKNNIRILSSSFLFTKGSLEEIEKSPITFIRVKYTTDTVDYPIRSELNSETMKKQYFPERYFIDYLKCIK
ncbi:MAG: hypothetical protein BM557_09685 [Flavobacterium sp. MedPE-SWcel]|uniref:hypothetical protein n=1 Tax=uncultured Flavobacterium sp. TaxID=165435 RepID=UPI000922835D|nr:hypothetical protein [uncultured Flavobacterium sp.]OIQ16572.1 MAG: hypothetical protein BM557_09685 [Flavobacterium sp. MedPE-SWcel]